MVLYGHVFRKRAPVSPQDDQGIFSNILSLFRLFMVKPLPRARVELEFMGKRYKGCTEGDGFFSFHWEQSKPLEVGWHVLKVCVVSERNVVIAEEMGHLLISSKTQYGFISDIDDTVLISYSATLFRRLRELLIKTPLRRKIFEESASWYRMLAYSKTDEQHPNPFFYVSSSEWNLYPNLELTFRHYQLPEGAFLLSHLKRWYQLFSTGKTNHEGKLRRIERILTVFPDQQFILIGDNTQRDPIIYARLAEKYADRIFAIYIRNIRPSKRQMSIRILQEISKKGIRTCLFKSNVEAIRHAERIGLIDP